MNGAAWSVRLALRGPVPCKKSKYRRSRGGGLHLDRATSATIDGLILQARAQWQRDPVDHPELVITFHCLHDRADRDGMLATLLDVLQRAGVIRNDSIRWFNGTLALRPAVVGGEEWTEVEIAT